MQQRESNERLRSKETLKYLLNFVIKEVVEGQISMVKRYIS